MRQRLPFCPCNRFLFLALIVGSTLEDTDLLLDEVQVVVRHESELVGVVLLVMKAEAKQGTAGGGARRRWGMS